MPTVRKDIIRSGTPEEIIVEINKLCNIYYKRVLDSENKENALDPGSGIMPKI